MKHLLLVAAVGLGAAASQAQTYPGAPAGNLPVPAFPPVEGVALRKAPTGADARAVPGRTVNYRWSATASHWEKNPELVTTSYNAVGYPTVETTADSATLQPIGRRTHTYDAANQALAETEEKWNGSSWENTYRNQYSRSPSQNIITERVFQSWKTGAWQNISRTVLAQNRYGADTLRLNQRWSNSGWVTENTSTQSYITYTAFRQYNELFLSSFDVATATFKPYSKTTYTYSSALAQQPAEIQEQLLNNGTYVNNARTLIIRDAESRPTQSEMQTWTTGGWVPSQRVMYSYSANAPGYTYTVQQYQQGTWVNNQRVTNSYDAYGNITRYLYELWKNGSWETQVDDRVLLRYDADNNVVRRVRQVYNIYNTHSTSLVNVSMSTHSNYQRIVLGTRRQAALAAQTVVYPNPVKGICRVSMPELKGSGVTEVEVLNTLGQAVQSYTLQRGPGQQDYLLDLHQLPSGPYTIRIQTAEGIICKPIVRQ